jgi:hypothetical protein
MNSRQKKVLLIGGALVALTLLFPPWEYFDPDSSGRSDAGYHFFLTPPGPQTSNFKYGVRFPEHVRTMRNSVRLILELVVTIPTVVGLALLLRSKRSVLTIALGILCLLVPAVIAGFMIWLMVSVKLEYGEWLWP